MKYGYCKNHPAIYAQNSRGLCAECTREKHRQSAESKGLIIKQKNEHRGNKTAIHTSDRGLQEPNEPIQSQQGLFKKKTAKIKHRSKKGLDTVKAELLLFQKIFNERPPWCEWCKASITVFSPMNYHHLRTKGSHPELRLVESNIVKICDECHMKEHGFKPKQRIDE